MTLRIGILALARSTFDVAFAEEVKGRALMRLEQEGFELIGPRSLLFDAGAAEAALAEMAGETLDLLLLLQVTFTDAGMTVRIAQDAKAPLGIWALPEPRAGGHLRLNAFCGLNLAVHALGRAGRASGALYAAPDAPEVESAIRQMAQARSLRLSPVEGGRRAAGATVEGVAPSPGGSTSPAPGEIDEAAQRVARRLRGARIGLVGEHPPGFDTCRYDADALRQLAGVEVDRVELGLLFDRARAVSPERVAASRARVAADLAGLGEVRPDELDRSLQVHGALEELAADRALSGLAVRCWPEMFTEFGCAACGPMAMMNGAGVPSACEADVLGAVTALMLQEVAGEPAFLVDLVDLDGASDTGVVWHCGLAPLSMADPQDRPRATIHSNRRMPLLHEFALKPGRVTVARISQARNEMKLVLGGAEMLRAPKSFTGTSGVLRFDRPAGEVLDRLIGEALEHHTAIVYGDHRPVLRALGAQLRLPVLDLA